MIKQGAMAGFRFGGGIAETVLHPFIAVGLLLAILLILAGPRNKSITPFLLAYFTIPMTQVLVLAGVHFTVHQILILAVLAKMAFQGKGKFPGGFNGLDQVVVLWSLLEMLAFIIQWKETQAVIKSLGDLVVNLGGYMAVRFLIPDRETAWRTAKVLAVICVIHGACMVSEQFTHQNVFSFCGQPSPPMRDGHIRSEAIMGSLYGGVFAGALVPLFVALWSQRKFKLVAFAGLAGATAMVISSHASTSWMAYGASLLGLACWPLRKMMRLVRWGIVVTLVGLHMVMNGPVWSLIEKIDLTGGSSSYHRYLLVDNCIRHFSDWWVVGYRYYGNWGFDTWDLCNQFVVAALTGGLLTLVLFIMIYSRGFGAVGRAMRRVAGDREREWCLWCQGSGLFANVVASFGINYTVYLIVFLYCLLACICQTTIFESKQATVRCAAPSTPGRRTEVECVGVTS